MPWDISDFQACLADHRRCWGGVDDALYALCRTHPRHEDIRGINAKAILIGRGFATGVERHIYSEGTQGSSIGQLAALLRENNAEVDGIIERLSAGGEPLDIEKLKMVVAEHGRFCRLLSMVSRRSNALPSFASKYLHFHCPIVPIYDSWVSGQAWRTRTKKGLKVFDKPDGAHDGFYWYALCFWQKYASLREIAPDISIRQSEVFLLWLATRASLKSSAVSV